MILQTGLRTDIPAFYSKWFANRLQAGFVCVRKVEYSLTERGHSLVKVLDQLCEWGNQNR